MHRFLRRVLNSVERGVRQTLVPQWRQHRIHEEEVLRRVFRLLNVDCVFDVGAHAGEYGMMLRERCDYKGQIISFEPTPDIFSKLRARASSDSFWEVYNFALGRNDGVATFELHQASVGSSFLPVQESDRQSPGNAILDRVPVSIKSLNSVLPSLKAKFNFTRPFLKMDTQGYDLEVFAGASNVLPSFVGLQSELSIKPFYKGAPVWLDALQVYMGAGFVLTAFVPVNADMSLELREVDCIMSRMN